MGFEIIDNFLSKQDFDAVRNTVCDMRFPWTYLPSVTSEVSTGPYDFQFVHVFYHDNRITSEYFDKIYPLIKAINPMSIVRLKANLITRTPENTNFEYHTDFEDVKLLKSAVYYIDSTDGPTRFQDGQEVECVANRLLIFNNNMLHSSTSCTDQKVRRVININYYDAI